MTSENTVISFKVSRQYLLDVLQPVVSVVEKRQTLPILSNVLLSVSESNQQLLITATDLETEMRGIVPLSACELGGDVTVPARKLVDIIKSLPDDADVVMSVQKEKLFIRSGRSKFSLSTLPAVEFPSIEEGPSVLEFELPAATLRHLINKTHFAMAHQDVRYYLNGILIEMDGATFRTVATDGHRLAMVETALPANSHQHQFILPRKGILELMRFMQTEDDEQLGVTLGSNHCRIMTARFIFTSKLIDGRFPDYNKVIPKTGDKTLVIEKDVLKHMLARVSILCNEKFKGIHFHLSSRTLKITASNPEHEQAEEEIEVDYEGESFDIGFNVKYLLDILSVIDKQVMFTFKDANSSVLVRDNDADDACYVVMPMRI